MQEMKEVLRSPASDDYEGEPVSTVLKSAQIIPSSIVVSVANSPIVPMGGTGLEIDLVLGGSVIGRGCPVMIGMTLL